MLKSVEIKNIDIQQSNTNILGNKIIVMIFIAFALISLLHFKSEDYIIGMIFLVLTLIPLMNIISRIIKAIKSK